MGGWRTRWMWTERDLLGRHGAGVIGFAKEEFGFALKVW
jgi:hypothetical protein